MSQFCLFVCCSFVCLFACLFLFVCVLGGRGGGVCSSTVSVDLDFTDRI